jgi:DNA-binding XRE family transcriptional regulator
MENLPERNRRSEQMTKEEHKAFKQYVQRFPTKQDAADILGFTRQTVDSILLKGSGKPESIKVIREKLNYTTNKAA